MALRIAGNTPPPLPVEEEALPPEEMAPEPEMPPMPEPAQMSGGAKVPAIIAMYKGPEMGPFQCSTCNFYDGDGQCAILDVPVEDAGLCNLWTPMDMGTQGEEELPEEAPAEAEVPEEAPEGLV